MPINVFIKNVAVNFPPMFHVPCIPPGFDSSSYSQECLPVQNQPYGLETVPYFAGSHVKFIGSRSALRAFGL